LKTGKNFSDNLIYN